MFSIEAVPKPALWLSLGGLIPFAAPPVVLWSGDPTLTSAALTLQFGYAAVILSFLGGVHWGRTLAGDGFGPDWPPLIWSVIPPLVGWALLLLPSPSIIAIGYALAFTAAYAVDLKSVKVGMFPDWYGRLRKILTIGVQASMLATLVASVVAVQA